MFRHKKHIFFDLDHTLWDYEANSGETLAELYTKYKLGDWHVTFDAFLNKFTVINEDLWDQFHDGLISKDVIRKDRFPAVMNALKIDSKDLAENMQVEYINVCPTKPHLVDGAKEILDAMQGKYELHIITNGFDEIQGVKLSSGKIDHFFNHVISSGMVGFQKPNREIFDYALNLANATPSNSVMVGDNPLSDIEGAYLAGIDQIFYNPNKLECKIKPTLEVTSLRELLAHF